MRPEGLCSQLAQSPWRPALMPTALFEMLTGVCFLTPMSLHLTSPGPAVHPGTEYMLFYAPGWNVTAKQKESL